MDEKKQLRDILKFTQGTHLIRRGAGARTRCPDIEGSFYLHHTGGHPFSFILLSAGCGFLYHLYIHMSFYEMSGKGKSIETKKQTSDCQELWVRTKIDCRQAQGTFWGRWECSKAGLW